MILSGFRGCRQKFPSGTLLHFRKRPKKSFPELAGKAFTALCSPDADIVQETGADLILTSFAHAAREAVETLMAETCIEATYNQASESLVEKNDWITSPKKPGENP